MKKKDEGKKEQLEEGVGAIGVLIVLMPSPWGQMVV